ncbi:MAG: aminoacyl-tRNA hydrolase [Candidatus Portnoybacteria bacterium]|nr:aminoacyl-tRNA hydrolase [Candidatus Portnoybacteria bacterium]
MNILIGLGNPGRKYKKTRHNAGFMVIDHLSKDNDFVFLKEKEISEAFIKEGRLNNKEVILAKPLTYMNNSGRAAKKLIDEYAGPLIVVHDDIDIPFGQIRVNKGIGSAGHKGVQSIIDTLGHNDFLRIRIGIRPDFEVDTEEYVLNKFSREQKKELKNVLENAVMEIKNHII